MSEEQELYWVQSCLLGDTGSFSHIVARYERMVRTMIGRLVDDEDQVEELAHQTFISAYENLAKFNGKSKLSTWIGKIALNKARDYLRSHRKRIATTEDFDDMEIAQDAPDLESQVQVQQNSRILERALGQLRSSDRNMIILRYLYEYDYNTIADILHCSKDAAKVRGWRAVSTLRGMLARMGAEI